MSRLPSCEVGITVDRSRNGGWLDEYRLEGAASLPPGEMRRVDVAGVPVCLVHADDGLFFAIDDTCSHGEESLSDGWAEGHEIECPRHGGTFDLETGRARLLPAILPLRAYAVTVDGRDVILTPKDEAD
jgi:nitrite reductase/ring-hydroxylating ferredoxin subunit